MNEAPWVRDVCLVGGGHSHSLLIRQWGMRPLPGVRLILVSSDSQTPYSGMLPGLVAGHYGEKDIHIDLRKLCAWAGVRFIEKTVTGVDPSARQIHIDGYPSIGFDVLSLDTGSTPDLSVPGSAEHVTPVKPVSQFYTRWQALIQRLAETETLRLTVGVVGSGAGGFELITAMRHVLPNDKARCLWFVRGELPLNARAYKVSRLALDAASRQGVEIVTGFDVSKVERGRLLATDGRHVELDEILWCTAASGPQWPGRAGLKVDSRGFVMTNAYLQSVSHACVFATGDIGTQERTPSAKAGVFAVRQAPILFHNIRRFLMQEPLKTYKPQKDFLSLMATGGQRAIASRGHFAIEADWVWRWKDHIDQTFMRRFTDLPAMSPRHRLNRLPDVLRDQNDTSMKPGVMRCKGCGSKVSSRVLDNAIARLQVINSPDIRTGLSPAADAATVTVAAGTLVQSVDQIDAIIDDPYVLGRVAVLHALSDVFTLNATPHSAQLLITLPAASETLVQRDLDLLMAGIVETLNIENCVLIGGHTNQGADMAVGVVVNAMLSEPSVDFRASSAREGDVLVLTQGLGIGTLFAGLMQGTTCGSDITTALRAMQMSNQRAAKILQQHDASAITDVTGFGLLGHLQRLLVGLENVSGASLDLHRIPCLPGAVQTAAQGTRSTLWDANSQVLQFVDCDSGCDEARYALLCDPQTSGGLLAVIPATRQDDCISALHTAGYLDSAVIGTVNSSVGLRIKQGNN